MGQIITQHKGGMLFETEIGKTNLSLKVQNHGAEKIVVQCLPRYLWHQ